MPVIGFLNSYSSDAFAQYFLPAFHQGLNQAGYVEGQNAADRRAYLDRQRAQLEAVAAGFRRTFRVMLARQPTNL